MAFSRAISDRRDNDPPDRLRIRLHIKSRDQYIIETIAGAQDFATQRLRTCNNDRPNMGLGGITPAQKLKMAA